MAYPVYHNSRNFSIIIHQRISKHQPRSCQNRQGRFSLQLPPMPSTQRVRTAQTGAGTGTRRKGNGLAPLPLLLSKGALIYHMNVVCAVLQTAFCASRHKRTGERPAERRTAHGNLPLQYQNHLPRQGQVRRCRRRLPGGGETHQRL